LASNREDAAKYADEIGYPVVLKIVSPDIIHKSDAGGVKLNLLNKSEVITGFDQIVKNAKKYKANASISGVSVQKMVSQGIEVIVGIKDDPQFGKVIMFGLGGLLTELLKDFSLRLVPISQREAEKMISEIRAHQLLEGYRNYRPSDKESLISILMKVSALVQQNPSIKEMDLNPVLSYPDGAVAIDARIILNQIHKVDP
jgi:acetyl-CoA synthetase (ADP-forming)